MFIKIGQERAAPGRENSRPGLCAPRASAAGLAESAAPWAVPDGTKCLTRQLWNWNPPKGPACLESGDHRHGENRQKANQS